MAIQLIESVNLTSSSTSISLTNIPQNYEHLWLIMDLQYVSGSQNPYMRFNGQTSNYSSAVGWTRGTVENYTLGPSTAFQICYTGLANDYIADITIPFYSKTQAHSYWGRATVSEGTAPVNPIHWMSLSGGIPNTTVITEIEIYNSTFGAGSKIDLYAY